MSDENINALVPKTSAPNKEETLSLLSELHKSPHITQRELSQNLNISLGKTNYLLQQLIKKGFIKMRNFSHNPGKLRKVKYILTPRGVKGKIELTHHFLKRKEAEYNRVKEEWETICTNDNQHLAKDIKEGHIES